MHVHFRGSLSDDPLHPTTHANYLFNLAVPFTANSFSGALVMPNLKPPLTTLDAVLAYKEKILEVTENFEPYMTLFFQDTYDRHFLEAAKPHITAIKLYPNGITTNSDGGVGDLNSDSVNRVLEIMQDLEIPLCVHGEVDGYVMKRESGFKEHYQRWSTAFPNLKIIMEHITDSNSVYMLAAFENLHATITVHHLLATLDDVVGGSLNPHWFCKPIPKRPEDREELRNLAFGKWHKEVFSKVMLGTDSAPHLRIDKESACGCAGVFSAPVALQFLAEAFFEEFGPEGNAPMQAFVSNHAVNIYGLKPPEKIVSLVREPSMVPEGIGGMMPLMDIVPMCAGQEVPWKIE